MKYRTRETSTAVPAGSQDVSSFERSDPEAHRTLYLAAHGTQEVCSGQREHLDPGPEHDGVIWRGVRDPASGLGRALRDAWLQGSSVRLCRYRRA